MSLSNPITTDSPIQGYVSWKGSEGFFNFYDRETKENQNIGEAIGFIVLDKRFTVGGTLSGKATKDGKPIGITANIVKYGEELTVYAEGKEIAKGTWKNIQEHVKGKGAKACEYLYICLITAKGNYKLCVLKVIGSAYGNWYDLKHRDGDSRLIKAAKGAELHSYMGTEYYKPIYSYSKKENDEAVAKAIQMDKELQAYFNGFAEGSAEPVQSAATLEVGSNSPVSSDNDTDDLPF